MSNEAILQKAIEKANSNGYETLSAILAFNVIAKDNDVPRLFEIIYSHDFAKSFFGEQKHEFGEIRNETIGCMKCSYSGFPNDCPTKNCWTYELQQMVISEDPIKYLESYL